MSREGREHSLMVIFSHFQIICVLQKKMSTWSTSPGLRSATWKQGQSCLRSPNLQHQVTGTNHDHYIAWRLSYGWCFVICDVFLFVWFLIFYLCFKVFLILFNCYVLVPDDKREETLWTVEVKKAFFTLSLLTVSSLAAGKRQCDPNAGRFVRYQFTPAFLQLRQVGAT